MKYAEKEGLDFYTKLWYYIGKIELCREIMDRAKYSGLTLEEVKALAEGKPT